MNAGAEQEHGPFNKNVVSMTESSITAKQSLLDFSSLDALHSTETTSVCRWSLVRRSENGEDQQRTQILASPFTIGRRPNGSLSVSDPTVSGKHAELYLDGNELTLVDVGSTNGTLLNGSRISEPTALADGDVVHFGQMVFSIERMKCIHGTAEDFRNKTFVASIPEDAVLYEGFDRLLNGSEIDPYFQPIVAYNDGATVGYEVLVRSRVKGLEFPDKIFRIAAMRTAEAKLSEICRSEGMLSGIQLDPHGTYFLNTHSAELETDRLFDSLRELRDDFPQMSIVLEIHESAITSVAYLIRLSAVLKELNIQLAYDDFGAGQARLVELFEVPPRFLKFDRSIIRGLENASKLHRASVRALVNMVHDLNVVALAEGVETPIQSEVCQELGFDMVQGFLFGRPQPRHHWLKKVTSAATLEFPASGISIPQV